MDFNFDELKTAAVIQIYNKSKELGLDLDVDEINKLSESAFKEWFNLSVNTKSSEYAYVGEYINESFDLLSHLKNMNTSEVSK